MKTILALFEFIIFIIYLGILNIVLNAFFITLFSSEVNVENLNEARKTIANIGFFGVVLFGPIIEEVLFRWPYILVARKIGRPIALAILVSIAFSLLHPTYNLIHSFFWSIFLCFLAVKTGSIKVPIFTHIINNLCAYVALEYYSDAFEEIHINLSSYFDYTHWAITGFSIIVLIWIHEGRLNMIIDMIEKSFSGLQRHLINFLWQVNNKM